MLKTILKFSLGLALLIGSSQACVLQQVAAVQPLDSNAIETAIAGTSAAAQTQTAQSSVLVNSAKSPTSTSTATRIPSLTPMPTYTFASLVTLVRVSRNTNCRAGPGEVYEKVGALRTGEVAEVVGRSADGAYWIIKNPQRPGKLCWLSGRYASVTGVAGSLHVFTPPPTPKPTKTPTRKPKPTHTPQTPLPPGVTLTAGPGFLAFDADITDSCSGEWWVDILLGNIGDVAFQSIYMIVSDTAVGTDTYLALDDFVEKIGCSSSTVDTLTAWNTAVVSSPVFPYDPTGHQLDITIRLCSEPARAGTCVDQTLNFTP